MKLEEEWQDMTRVKKHVNRKLDIVQTLREVVFMNNAKQTGIKWLVLILT